MRGKGIPAMSLGQASIGFLQGDCNTNTLLKAFMEDGRVKRIVATIARGKGVDGHIGDIVQDAAVLFFEKYANVPGALTLADEESIYSLVFSICDSIAMSKRRDLHINRHDFVSLDDVGEDDSADQPYFIDIDNSFEELSLADIEESRGAREIDRLLSNGMESPLKRIMLDVLDKHRSTLTDRIEDVVPGKIMDEPINQPAVEKNITEGRLSPEQLLLKKIRKEIGMKLEDYSTALGIGKASLLAYIYGRTAGVPPDVMQTARTLLEDHKARFQDQANTYESRDMNQIIDDWNAIIGVERDDKGSWMEKLADTLGIQTVTIKRWVKGKYRPALLAIIEYGQKIEDWKEKNAR